MTDNKPGRPSDRTPDSESQRLRRQLSDADSRIATLERSGLHGAILLTLLVLVAGLMLPFFVRRSGEGRSATLWQALGEDAPSSVMDSGGFWAIPITATIIVMVALCALWDGASAGKRLVIAKILAIAYLVGCVLGLAVLGGTDERPRLTATSPGLVAFLVGAVLAVGIMYSPLLQNVRDNN